MKVSFPHWKKAYKEKMQHLLIWFRWAKKPKKLKIRRRKTYKTSNQSLKRNRWLKSHKPRHNQATPKGVLQLQLLIAITTSLWKQLKSFQMLLGCKKLMKSVAKLSGTLRRLHSFRKCRSPCKANFWLFLQNETAFKSSSPGLNQRETKNSMNN